MDFDELLITTGVDALVRLVKEKDRVELEDASSTLNIPQETIEDWSRVLEEQGILRIEYRLTRVFLCWVNPTEEELSQERQSFYDEKKGLEAEVAQVRQKIASGTGEVEDLKNSFSEFYARVYGRMDALEKMVAPVPAAKTISDDLLAKSRQELSSMEDALREAKEGIKEAKGSIASIKVEKGAETTEKLMAKVEGLVGDLAALQKELSALQKRSSGTVPKDFDIPSVRDIKKKFEGLKKEFSGLKSQSARMREDMASLHESSEILKEVAESIMGQEDHVGSLRAEMAELSKEAEALQKRSDAVISRINDNAELAERLSDSVDVSKAILKKFPSQEKVLEGIVRLEEAEKSLEEKAAALEKLLEFAGGKKAAAGQFGDIAKKMDAKARQMRVEMDSLAAALDDEKRTYLTFQKIKERVVPSIERYRSQLDSMEARITEIREQSSSQMREITEEAKKLQVSMDTGQVKDAMKLAEEIRGKKKMLDEVRSSLDGLAGMAESLNKRVTLLSREAKLLEIRAGGEGRKTDAPQADEKTVRKKLALTQEEEMEFRKKREELKKLIQKLWEE